MVERNFRNSVAILNEDPKERTFILSFPSLLLLFYISNFVDTMVHFFLEDTNTLKLTMKTKIE